MKLQVQEFVENHLSRARYEYDESVQLWAGWIVGLPGVYAQGNSVEEVRVELAEILEEYLLVSLREQKKVKGFAMPRYA